MAFTIGVHFFHNTSDAGLDLQFPEILRRFLRLIDESVVRLSRGAGLQQAQIPLFQPTKNLILVSDTHVFAAYSPINAGAGGSYEIHRAVGGLIDEDWVEQAVIEAVTRTATTEFGWEQVESLFFERTLLAADVGTQSPVAERIGLQIVERARTATEEMARTALAATTVYNLNGPGARVTINSTDNSTNVVNVNAAGLFRELLHAVSTGVADSVERTTLLDRVSELESHQNTPGFARKYAEFMSLAANHMQVVLPFVPALTQLLTSLPGQ